MKNDREKLAGEMCASIIPDWNTKVHKDIFHRCFLAGYDAALKSLEKPQPASSDESETTKPMTREMIISGVAFNEGVQAAQARIQTLEKENERLKTIIMVSESATGVINQKGVIAQLKAECARLRDALKVIRHHVVGHKGNGEIISDIDKALEVTNG